MKASRLAGDIARRVGIGPAGLRAINDRDHCGTAIRERGCVISRLGFDGAGRGC